LVRLPVILNNVPSNVKLLSALTFGDVPSKVITPLSVVPLIDANPELPLLPGAPFVPDVPELNPGADVPEVPEKPEVPEVIPGADVPDEPLTPDVPEEPEVTP
jgi:hypothetical protein